MKNSNVIINTILLSFFLFTLGSCNHTESFYKNQEQVTTETKSEELKNAWEKSQPEPISEPELIGTGKIITNVDGIDVRQVKLWSSTYSNRTIVCSLTNKHEVKILEDEDPYYLVQATKDSKCKGYCMKSFVKMK